MKIQGKSIPSRGKSQSQGTEVGAGGEEGLLDTRSFQKRGLR